METRMDITDEDRAPSELTLCEKTLIGFAHLLIVLTWPLSIWFCFKTVQQYERAIYFRLGRAVPGALGPGFYFIQPCTDRLVIQDLRTMAYSVPPQEILTKDSVTITVDAVVYYRINNPFVSVCGVVKPDVSTKLLAMTTLRNFLGTKTLSEILTEREHLSRLIQNYLDEGTETWGVQVERTEIKDVRLPVKLQRAMAAEAEAYRNSRAQVLVMEGEINSSRVAYVLANNPKLPYAA